MCGFGAVIFFLIALRATFGLRLENFCKQNENIRNIDPNFRLTLTIRHFDELNRKSLKLMANRALVADDWLHFLNVKTN